MTKTTPSNVRIASKIALVALIAAGSLGALLVTGTASAEPKHRAPSAKAAPKAPKSDAKPRKPSVYAADACQEIKLSGAEGEEDGHPPTSTVPATSDGVMRDTAMVCETKNGSARVLKSWRLLAFGDGDMFVVGR